MQGDFSALAAEANFGSTAHSPRAPARYNMLAKAGIPGGRAYLEAHFPGGLALPGAYVAAGALQALDAAVDEALDAGAWADAAPLSPASLAPADAAELLARCPSVQALGGCSETLEREAQVHLFAGRPVLCCSQPSPHDCISRQHQQTMSSLSSNHKS
jgi:hypothetical protein